MRERGFSLIELMVAMVITLLIMGAVYGLIAGGQNAFRREPELAERQQNIRMAMDLIMKDISNAAAGLPTFVQAFTPGLDACAGCPHGPGRRCNGRDRDPHQLRVAGHGAGLPHLAAPGGTDASTQLMRDVTVASAGQPAGGGTPSSFRSRRTASGRCGP